MKHFLLLAAAITGLCCAASTPWAQIKDKMPRAKTQAQSPAQAQAIRQIISRATPSQFMPKTINAYGNFTQVASEATVSAMAGADFAIQSKTIIIDTTTSKAEYDGGLLTKLSPDNKCQYIIENSDGKESSQQTYTYKAIGTISYFHNSKNLLDSANYDFDYSMGDKSRKLALYHKYGYDNNAQCIIFREMEYANGNLWYGPNSSVYDYKAATDSTPESVSTVIDGFVIKRYTVLETNSQGAPTKVSFIYGSISAEKTDTTYEIIFSDIEWAKANAPSKIFKLGLDMSYTIYNDITLQNVLQNWVTNDNQLKCCNYKLISHSRFYVDHSGTVTVAVKDNNITIAVKDKDDSEYDNTLVIARDSDGNINVDGAWASYSLYQYPDNLPDYAVKFITGTTANLLDIQRTSDFTTPTTIGEHLYSPVPFTLEYDNNGALTRIVYKDNASEEYDGLITQEFDYVIVFSDFNPYTGISQPEAKAQWKAIGGNGLIAVSGVNGEQVAVYAVNGRLAYNAPVADSATISVPAGIYIVKVGAKACKVIVR